MAVISQSSWPKGVASILTKGPTRKTRWSVVKGDLEPPYLVDLVYA
jgi:hypothetical protein